MVSSNGHTKLSNGDSKPTKEEKPYKMEIVWRNVIIFIVLHYFFYKAIVNWDKKLFAMQFTYGFIASFGIPVGAHRYWAHRSFKANYAFQVLMMIFQTICIQNDIIEWVRDHRVHHKFSDTDADPSNSKRGFFFSHMGWLMCKKHPDVRKYGAKVDMSDLESDPLLLFQRKYYLPMVLILAVIIPIYVTWRLLSYPFLQSFYMNTFRYVLSLHITWCTNSVAHVGSWKPYDKTIAASDSRINGTLTFGEGWHNFHHTFPWDYKVSEKPLYRHNFGMMFIDFFAWLGWVTDLKIASEDLIRKRVLRTGDGSHPFAIEEAKKQLLNEDYCNNNIKMDGNGDIPESEVFWGIGDKDIPKEEIDGITTLCKKYDS
ncbi:delta(9)-fatty-acid desaturase fat-7-like [Chironomus tepperi]|uniref:delta(9)-fatty-acid desaturase fat-7-like n=1 Tax=Chironomus tepperi TaxID=113505 RepID=UPI00391F5386